jgi:hypothetical protein
MEEIGDYELEVYKLEEMRERYPQYNNMNYRDLLSGIDELTNRLQREVKYNSDPSAVTDLNRELSYMKDLAADRGV